MNPYLAYGIKIVGTGVFVANAVLLAAMGLSQEIPDVYTFAFAGLSGLQGALTYAGIGQVSKTLEPQVGIRKEES